MNKHNFNIINKNVSNKPNYQKISKNRNNNYQKTNRNFKMKTFNINNKLMN